MHISKLLCLTATLALIAGLSPANGASAESAEAFGAPILLGNGITTPQAVADLDGDGRLDLIASGPGGLIVLKNITTTTAEVKFEQTAVIDPKTVALPPKLGALPIQIADIDGDGRLDVVLGETRNILIYRNTSLLGKMDSFSLTAQIQTNLSQLLLYPLYIADLNADAKADLFLSIEPPSLASTGGYYYINTSHPGAISFSDPAPSPISRSIVGTPGTFTDVDGDGKVDYFYWGSLFRNMSTPGLVNFDVTATPTPRVDSQYWRDGGSLAVDFTGDGKPDWAWITPLVLRASPTGGTKIDTGPPLFALAKNLSTPGEFKFSPMGTTSSQVGYFP